MGYQHEYVCAGVYVVSTRNEYQCGTSKILHSAFNHNKETVLTMKITAAAALLLLPAVATAFAPLRPTFGVSSTALCAKPAASKEEDLELTRKVILDFMEKEMGAEEQAEEPAPAPAAEEKSEE